MHVLADPAYTVPPPGPPGPFGTMAWLRATVSRFANGETHARRRGLVEARLRELDPAELRAAAAAARAAGTAASDTARADGTAAGDVPRAYLPVAVLAAATGVNERDVAEAVAHVRVVAAAYRPGTDAPGADEALRRLLELLPPQAPEAAAQHVALLVQGCEPMAALINTGKPLDVALREDPPVPSTKRLDARGNVVTVDLTGHPFGAGPRRCPGEAHARALVEGVIGR